MSDMFFVLASQGPPADTTPPSQVTGLSAYCNGLDTQVDLSWNNATDNVGVTGYEIQYSIDGSTWNSEDTRLSTGNAYFFFGFITTNYWFRVRAYDAASNYGAWSATSNMVTTGDQI